MDFNLKNLCDFLVDLKKNNDVFTFHRKCIPFFTIE